MNANLDGKKDKTDFALNVISFIGRRREKPRMKLDGNADESHLSGPVGVYRFVFLSFLRLKI